MEIPKKAKRVFSGIIFNVYHWQQQLFDGSYSTFEMIQRPNTLQIIPLYKGNILLTYEKQPDRPYTYSMFGGRQDKNETPLKGAKREFLEESGMISNDWELFKIYEPSYKTDWKIYTYIARNCERVARQKLEPGEKITIKKYNFQSFISRVCSPQFMGHEFALDMFRMKEHPKKLLQFKKNLFSK